MKLKKTILIYTAGLVSGIGALALGGSFATDSVVPYTFEDGQLISADVMNDLFAKIRNTTMGFESASELTGQWACSQYEVGGTVDPTRTNSKFSQNPTTKVWSASNNWTFSNSGQDLRVTDFLVGTMRGANNLGVCVLNTGNTYYDYSVTLAEGFLLLGEKSMLGGCTTMPVALPIQKMSPSKFKFITADGFGVCAKQNQPPTIPSGLSISGGSLVWTDNSTNETGFIVMKKTSSTSWTDVTTLPADTLAYPLPSLTTGDKYRIRATNSNGDSLGSNVVRIQ